MFVENWKKLTSDRTILNVVKGWEIPLLDSPFQAKPPGEIKMSPEEMRVMDEEVEDMSMKGAIREAIPKQDQFLSNVFVTPKSDGGFRPITNLKKLNKSIPYHHFKMEGLKEVKHLLQKGDYMCKLDLKDAYFSVPLSTKSRKFARFRWRGKLYEFLCLCFGLGPAPRIFTKLMKVPVSVMRKLNVRLVIYLDDILLMASSREELLMARDTTRFLLQQLGLTLNLKKSELEPQFRLKFLGVIVDSLEMKFYLPMEKVTKFRSLCQKTLTSPQITLRDLSSLIGTLRSTSPAIFPAPLHLRGLQQVCIQAQNQNRPYDSLVLLSNEGLEELDWWIKNLDLWNGCPLSFPPPEMIIFSDAAKTGG